MKKTPKYRHVFNDMISGINAGKYQSGSQLPSETELTKIYGVSKITVRRAIDELYRAGYIDKQQGKRGCVLEIAISQELATASSYTEEIRLQGMTPSRKVILSELRLCNAGEQKKLNLDKTSPVFSLQRIICADKKPLCVTEATLPYALFRDIENYDFSKNSLYDIIENKYHIPIVNTLLKLKAVSADPAIADYLEIDVGVPLILFSAVTYGEYDKKEIPIEIFKTHYLTDRFEYMLTQRRRFL